MKDSSGPATEYALLLFATALAPVAYLYFTSPAIELVRVLLAVSAPAASSVVFGLLASLRPALLGQNPRSFVLCLTLPLAHHALLVLISALAVSMPDPLLGLPEELSLVPMWLDWRIGLVLVGAQAIATALWIAAHRRPSR